MPTLRHRVGPLRHRVTISEEAGTSDGAGGRTLAWTEVCTVWGEVRPIEGRETEVAEGQQAAVSNLVVIRFRDDVTAGMKATVKGVAYNIRTVIDPELRGVWLELLCDRGVAV